MNGPVPIGYWQNLVAPTFFSAMGSTMPSESLARFGSAGRNGVANTSVTWYLLSTVTD